MGHGVVGGTLFLNYIFFSTYLHLQNADMRTLRTVFFNI